jgi:hypothetical protein
MYVLIIANYSRTLFNALVQLQFPKNTTEALYALISPQIKPFGDKGAYGLPCSEVTSLKSRIDLTFIDQTGKVCFWWPSPRSGQ